jgi:hypothetical protein
MNYTAPQHRTKNCTFNFYCHNCKKVQPCYGDSRCKSCFDNLIEQHDKINNKKIKYIGIIIKL